MPSILPPTTDTQDETPWRLPAEFWTVKPIALGTELVYAGPFPSRPRDYYPLAHGCRQYVYILSGWGEALYVGRSHRPGNRFDRHRRKAWFRWVEDVTILGLSGEDCDGAIDMLETYAIRRLRPLYNLAKVPA